MYKCKSYEGEKMSVTIALLRQPNSWKSKLFNSLTGLRQYIGKWSERRHIH